uniref:Uncharacterized protein n=1 Tax=Arundo donax TaxID=35708 RepID=A0A0A9A4R2_ARUDO
MNTDQVSKFSRSKRNEHKLSGIGYRLSVIG